MDKKSLDFLIIGAMRSGTTTLYELLKNHPEVQLPPGKEVPFFSEDNEFRKGLDWYLKKNFTSQPPVKGTITPQYMYNTEGRRSKITAERISKSLGKDLKIIAILRHPIQRAFSHHSYALRHNYDDRPFQEAVSEIIDNPKSEVLKDRHNQRYSYLSRSEYGNSLSPYFDYFASENLLILFTDELEHKPEQVFKKICTFIGVTPDYNPRGLGNTFHKGGAKAKLSFLTPGKIGRLKPIMKIYRLLIPYKIRKRFEIWFHAWNIKKDNSKLDPNSDTYKKLVGYFEKDVKLLEKLTGKKTPWKDWS